MKGKYLISISTNRIQYDIELERSVTILKGESGSGKTTLLKILAQLQNPDIKSIKTSVSPQRQMRVLTNSDNWDWILREYRNQIIFIDEDVQYAFNQRFLSLVRSSGSYIVIISRRKPLEGLNFSISSIMELKRTHKEGQRTYNRMFPLYHGKLSAVSEVPIICEDTKGGKEIIEKAFCRSVIGAGGNTKVYQTILESAFNGDLDCIVDGAAFGAYIDKLITLRDNMNLGIYAPESMKYLILSLPRFLPYLANELTQTWDYCDSKEYSSWESFFTNLLNDKLREIYIGKGYSYSKDVVPPFVFEKENLEIIKKLIEQSRIEG